MALPATGPDRIESPVPCPRVGRAQTQLIPAATRVWSGAPSQLPQPDEAPPGEPQTSFEALINAVDGIVWEANALTLHFTFVSQQAQRLLGYDAEEWLADPTFWRDHLHPQDREQVMRRYAVAAAEKRSCDLEYRLIAADGRTVWFRDLVTVAVDGEGPAKLCGLMVDITRSKQRERETEAVASVSAAMRVASSRAEMMPIIVAQLLGLLSADGAALALRNPATGETVFESTCGQWRSAAGQRLPPGAGVSGYVIATGHTVLDNDPHHGLLFTRGNWPAQMRSLACAPLIVHGEAIGALLIGSSTRIHNTELRLLTAVADIAANAIHRVTLHEQAGQHLRRLAALRAIDQAISSNLDLSPILQVLLHQVVTELGVDAACILTLNPHTHCLEFAGGRGFRTATIKRTRLASGECLAGQAMLTRRVTASPDLFHTHEFVRASLLADEGFFAYFGAPLMVNGQVKGVLEIFHRTALTPDPDWLDFLETLAGQAAIAVDQAALFADLQRTNADMTLAYDATLEGWSNALDLRDKATKGHAWRVTEMTVRLARAMGVAEQQLTHIYRGALLHDIGKIGIPDSILHKSGPLTLEEWAIMQRHPIQAHEILAPIAYLQPALDIPYYHHERWDGTGYPHGLQGEGIPLAARIFAVVDVWDALSSDRPYREAWPAVKVSAYLRSQAGTHFDPCIVEKFLKILESEA